MEKNITTHTFQVTAKDRKNSNKHNPLLLWFTGLSGSGKSTIANVVEKELYKKGVKTYILDGDNIRNGINKDLTFSPEDRTENIRRISEIANLMLDAGLVVLAAFVSPYQKDRQAVKEIVGIKNFAEIYISTDIETCKKRDTKGLYKMAEQGKIKNMTGISAPYQAPNNPAITIPTETLSVEEAAQKIINYITPKLKLKNA
ncbi:MAG: adenylyl-sulfate kinase [Oceanihabitans sp.]